MPQCPFANLDNSPTEMLDAHGQCPFHRHKVPSKVRINDEVPLVIRDGAHSVSKGTAGLLADIGGGDRIREFCTRFYARMFADQHLQQFIFLDDGAAAHAKRLADWTIQKMGGEGTPWTESGRWGMRQISHHSAWYSPRRDPAVRGRRFKVLVNNILIMFPTLSVLIRFLIS